MSTLHTEDFSGSINQNASPNLLAVNQSPLIVNCSQDQTGIIGMRLGSTLFADTISGAGSIQGGACYIKDDGTYTPIVFAGGNLYEYNSGTDVWDLKQSNVVATDSTVECTNYLNTFYFIGSGDTEYLQTWDGTTLATVSGNIEGSYLAASTGRLVCGGGSGTTPRRWFYSNANSATFTVGVDYIDTDLPGTAIVPLGESAPFLIFDNDSLYIVDVNRATSRKLDDFGCSSHRSAKVIQGHAIWLGRGGIFMFSATDAYPTKISTTIENELTNDALFNQISGTGFTNAAAGIWRNKYMLSVGDLSSTVGGETLNDCMLVFDIKQVNWTVRTYTANGLGAEFIIYKDTSGDYAIYSASRDTKSVYKLEIADTYTDEDSTGATNAYTSIYRTKHHNFAGARRYSSIGFEVAKRLKRGYVQYYAAGTITYSYCFDGASSYTNLSTISASVAGQDWDYETMNAPTNNNFKTVSLEFRTTSNFRIYQFDMNIIASGDAELQAV